MMPVWGWLTDAVLMLLLTGTLAMAIRLDRALRVVRRDRTVFETLITNLSSATSAVKLGIQALRNEAEQAATSIGLRSEEADKMATDLSFLIEAADRAGAKLEERMKAVVALPIDKPAHPAEVVVAEVVIAPTIDVAVSPAPELIDGPSASLAVAPAPGVVQPPASPVAPDLAKRRRAKAAARWLIRPVPAKPETRPEPAALTFDLAGSAAGWHELAGITTQRRQSPAAVACMRTAEPAASVTRDTNAADRAARHAGFPISLAG